MVCGTQFDFHRSELYNISGRGVSKGTVKWKIVKIRHIQKWNFFRPKEWCSGFYWKKSILCKKKQYLRDCSTNQCTTQLCSLCQYGFVWERSQRRRTVWLMSSGNHVGTLTDSETRLSNFVLKLIDQLGLTWTFGYIHAIRLHSCFSRI